MERCRGDGEYRGSEEVHAVELSELPGSPEILEVRTGQCSSHSHAAGKYETLAQRVVSPAKVAALRDAVPGTTRLPDAREILVLLS